MAALTLDQVESLLKLFTDKKPKELSEAFAEDAVFSDPFYPEPEYHGRESIHEAFNFLFKNVMKTPSFTLLNYWVSEYSCCIEVETYHVLQNGATLHFPQVIVFESEDDLIVRWQSYLPFPPTN
jgi:hypothetical protein